MKRTSDRSGLHRLIYTSLANPQLELQDFQSILSISHRNNSKRQITGALVLGNRQFMQCLEGDRQDLTETFFRIANDERHSNIQLVDFSHCSERQFNGWAMRHLDFKEELVRRAISKDEFKPMTWTASTCHSFLLRYDALLPI